jgi:TPR repeat protein
MKIIKRILIIAILLQNIIYAQKINTLDDAVYALEHNNTSKALKIYESLADLGNKKAILRLGSLYLQGKYNIKPNYNKAIYYLQMGSEYDIEANYALSLIYLYGFNVERNYDKAFELLYQIYKNYKPQDYDNKYDNDLNILSFSIYNLSYMVFNGLGTPKDIKGARQLFMEAVFIDANDVWQGLDTNCKTQSFLKGIPFTPVGLKEIFNSLITDDKKGITLVLYTKGICTKSNLLKSLSIVKNIDFSDLPQGALEYSIGSLYNDNNFKKYSKAKEYFIKSATLEYQPAILKLAEEYNSYQSTIVLKNPRKSFYYYKKGAELGNSYSMRKLGEIYLTSKVIKQDFKEAKKWIGKAFQNGDKYSSKIWDKYELWKY